MLNIITIIFLGKKMGSCACGSRNIKIDPYLNRNENSENKENKENRKKCGKNEQNWQPSNEERSSVSFNEIIESINGMM